MSRVQQTLKPGTRNGRYEIRDQIGRGGMGDVYRAFDPQLGRDVAIKFAAERFGEHIEREARATAPVGFSSQEF
jgi:serine/threonine-protein kinase